MGEGDVVLESRFPEIIAGAEGKAGAVVDKTTHDIEAAAKLHLVENKSVDTSALLNSGAAHVDGLEGEVTFGTDHAHFVEYGTGELGAASDFPGKPDDISYTVGGRYETRARSIESVEHGAVFEDTYFNAAWHGMAARPYLTPAVEEAREPFELALGEVYG